MPQLSKENIIEIENSSGLYRLEKLKLLHFLGYGERIAYKINLDTGKTVYKEIK